MICNETIGLTTHSNTNDTILERVVHKGVANIPSTSTTPPLLGPLHIEKPIPDIVLCPPKSTILKSTFNPSTHVVENYNIFVDMA